MAGGPVVGSVKGLSKILLGGFAGFMVLAMIQERDVFRSAWFGRASETIRFSEDEQKAAADIVHLTLTVMGHLYASGGDSRFADRIPASDGVVQEILADVEYLARNQRRQEMSLERLEILSLDPLGADAMEIRTREHWQVRFLWAAGGGEADPPRAQITHGKYLLIRGQRGWRVEGWDLIDRTAEQDAPT